MGIFPQSRYARNVITLMTGTGIAQAIPIALSPILTRLYSPEDFGLFALSMAVISVASVLVSGRYEQAIMLPRQDRDAFHIIVLVVLLSFAISVTLLLVVAMFNQPIAALLGAPGLSTWLYWVPLSTFLMGTYQGLNYWSNRRNRFKRLAISRTVQSGAGALAQMAFAGVGPVSLLGGQVSGQAMATGLLVRMLWREERGLNRNINKFRIIALAKKYSNFPKYLIVAHGFNAASGQMPALLLTVFFSASTAGFFALTQRVLGAPLSLVGGALGDVFRQEASQAYIYQGDCKVIYERTFKLLVLISLPMFVVFFFVAPCLFSWVFGEQWRIAGEYAQIMIPKFLFDFVAGPLSAIFVIAQKQKSDLLWQIILILAIVTSFSVGYVFSDVKLALICFSFSYCVMQSVNIFLSYRFAMARS